MDFILRKFKEEDAESLCKAADNNKISDNLRDGFPKPYLIEHAATFIQSCKEDDEHKICRAIVIGGKAVGSIGIHFQEDVYRKSAEIGYFLGEPYWGKGIMTRAIKEMCELIFCSYDIVRIYAQPYAYNIASRKALEKAGFVLEGILKSSVIKCGNIIDSCMYALIKK